MSSGGQTPQSASHAVPMKNTPCTRSTCSCSIGAQQREQAREDANAGRTACGVEVAGRAIGPVGEGGHATAHQKVDAVAVEGLGEANDVRNGHVRQNVGSRVAGCTVGLDLHQPSDRRSPSPMRRFAGRPGCRLRHRERAGETRRQPPTVARHIGIRRRHRSAIPGQAGARGVTPAG